MKSINHIELPFNLPFIYTNETDNEKLQMSLDQNTFTKNKKCENYFLYPHKKENMYEKHQNISIFHQKSNHYIYLRAEERLNSFLRKKLQFNIDKQKRLQSENDENYQYPTRNQSTEHNITTLNPFQEYKLKVSLPHLMPVIKSKQISSPSRKVQSPYYDHDVKKIRKHEKEQTSSEQTNQSNEKKQFSPCSIVHLNNNLQLPSENQRKKLLVNLNLERLLKLRAKKKIIQEFITQSINNTPIEDVTQPLQLPKEETFIQRIDIKRREKYPERVANSFVDKQRTEKCRLKKRVNHAQTELDQVSQIYDFKPERKLLKTKNTNKLTEFNHKLQTLAFQDFQEWQREEEEFDPIGDYVNKLKKNQEK